MVYLKHCNCVLYYMPRRHHNITICGQSDFECVRNVKKQLKSRQNESFTCSCWYGCHAIKYEMGLSSTPIFGQTPFLTKKHVLAENVAILHVYYQSTVYRSQKKEQLVGLTEFLCEHLDAISHF